MSTETCAAGEVGEVAIKLVSEGEQLVAMVVEKGAEGLELVAAKMGTVAQLGDHEVVQDAAVGARRAAHGEDIFPEPIRKDVDLVGQGDGSLLLGRGVVELGRQTLVGAAVAVLMGGGFAFEVVAGSDGLVGLIFQDGNDGDHFLQTVKDIAPARRVGVGQIAAGAQAGTEVGDEGLGIEAAVLEFEQTYAPGHAIPIGFLAEQEAIGRDGIDADEHRKLSLEDLVDKTVVDRVEALVVVEVAGLGDGLLEDVVDASEGNVLAETVVKVADNATKGTTAIKHEGNDVLLKPSLGDRKVKEHFVIVLSRRGERLLQGLLGNIDLLVHEFAADIGLLGQTADGESSAEGLKGQILSFLRSQ